MKNDARRTIPIAVAGTHANREREALSSPAAEQHGADIDRREFVKLAAASAALAGLGACSRAPQETIVPYVHFEPAITPGLPLYFATAHVHSGYASGVLVASHSGRPTKVEGNPRHPASLGATDVFAQASVLELWDPDRSQTVRHLGSVSSFDVFSATLQLRLQALERKRGQGLHVLTRNISSPSFARQMQSLRQRFPSMHWHAFEPISRDNVYAGTQLAFGRALEPRYDFTAADVVVALDADFLSTSPGRVRYAHDFATRRKADNMSRLYAIEPMLSITGAKADHRFALRRSEVEAVARALGAAVGVEVPQSSTGPLPAALIGAIARDLKAHPGRSLVIAGEAQPPLVHALTHAINARLGNIGHTVTFSEPVPVNVAIKAESLLDLCSALDAASVDTLLIIDANPVYDAPADLTFGKRLQQARFSAQLGLYTDETARACEWHLPQAHQLESWSDARAFDGTAGVLQPLISPLYGGTSPHELLALIGGAPLSSHAIVRNVWRERSGLAADDFERYWKTTLHDGLIADSRFEAKSIALDARFLATVPNALSEAIEIDFVPDASVWDGRYANNGWLQELPRPLTDLTWDNAALVSPALAAQFGLANEDLVELSSDGASVFAPVWIQPGHADASITVALGYGRSNAGKVAARVGFDANRLRKVASLWNAPVTIRKTGQSYPLASTQHHHDMEGRRIVRAATLEQFRSDPRFAQDEAPTGSLYPPVQYDGYKWGMSIDLSTCTGCNACTIACQAENNIPIVGKREVARGREMHWIRVDRYREGGHTHFQPVPCMQCENAPCEVVCPVEASVHDSEGINVQVYNRCVGTRFCSNNCPYKVRRFNWLQYSSNTPTLKAQKNPEVSVRDRGVMEKCNYCLQRIANGRITADRENRRIQDGEVISACAAACPVSAIVFGDLNDPASAVNAAKASPLNYALLGELNTRPRTTYLAKLTNPNPDISRA